MMVENFDKMWTTGEWNVKPLQYSCLETPMNSLKMQKTMMLEDKPPRSVGDNMLTWEEQRNIPRKNEETEPKQK